ncbi:hypothetical protein FSP39_016817 [Pinctada imbricata]|uniref:Neurotransmitter-gated ion-channel ligand-binding domain-containing protein n=1 Tax=Pinctada imbricata TaxID=66713 RepID=A0AA88XNV4_PINIB|nr:hypothetical protein FSP39_016817 [Pinctada imbricata]
MWNSTEYNGVNVVRLFQSEVWHPVIVPLSSARAMKSLGDDWMYITFVHSGYALWVPTDIFSSACHPDVTKYPFDIQLKPRSPASLPLLYRGYNPSVTRRTLGLVLDQSTALYQRVIENCTLADCNNRNPWRTLSNLYREDRARPLNQLHQKMV